MSIRVNYKASEKITSTSEMNVLSCQITSDGTFTGVVVFDMNIEDAEIFLCEDDRFTSFSLKQG